MVDRKRGCRIAVFSLVATGVFVEFLALGGCSLDENGSVDLAGRECFPETLAECYHGPPGTKKVGVCLSGVAVCRIDGTYGDCVGEVLPTVEDCFTPADEDCDGLGRGDEECHCTPLETMACVTGGLGVCAKGVRTCALDGAAFDVCVADEDPSPENCARPEDENCDGQTPACTGDLSFARSSGGLLSDVAFAVATNGVAQAIAGVADGDVFFRTVNAGSAYVERRDGLLNLSWKRAFPSVGGRSVVRGVAVSPKGGIIGAGHFYGSMDVGGIPLVSNGEDAFVFTIDALGKVLWAKRFGDINPQVVNTLALGLGGVIAVGGEVFGTIDLGSGPKTANGNDAFVALLDSKGTQIWSRLFGDGASQRVYGVAFTPDEDLVVVGEFDGVMDLGSGPLTSASTDVFVACLAKNDGAPKWGIKLGDDGFAQHGYAVAVGPGGEIAVTGGFGGSMTIGQTNLASASADDVFVVVLEPGGALRWAKRYGDAAGAEQVGSGITFDEAGNVIVTGHFDGTIDFGTGPLMTQGQADVFVAKLGGDNGDLIWAKQAGDGQIQRGFGVAASAGARLFVGGGYQGTLDWGAPTMPLTSVGGADWFMVTIAP